MKTRTPYPHHVDAAVNAARFASQTDPNNGVDPYNTHDRMVAQREMELDFAAWVQSYGADCSLLKTQAE
jgi:hypothetical protein